MKRQESSLSSKIWTVFLVVLIATLIYMLFGGVKDPNYVKDHKMEDPYVSEVIEADIKANYKDNLRTDLLNALKTNHVYQYVQDGAHVFIFGREVSLSVKNPRMVAFIYDDTGFLVWHGYIDEMLEE